MHEDTYPVEDFSPAEHEMAQPPEPRFWSKPIVLVLVSVLLSCGISGVVVSFGWKASMDTFAAVNRVKQQEYEERLVKLESNDADRIKASDLAMRDQLLDAKLSLLQAEIAALKDQISDSRMERR